LFCPKQENSGKERTNIVTQLPIQVWVAITMGSQVPQIKGQGSKTRTQSRKTAHLDLGRPQIVL
jgi:hypothetical protein